MLSPKQKKSSLPSSSKNSSKLSAKSHNPLKKTTKPKISKTTPKLDKPKKPTEPADENLSHLFKASAWNDFYAMVLKPAFSHLLNKRRVGDSFQPWLDELIASEVQIIGSSKSPGLGVKTALQKTWQLDKTGTGDLHYRFGLRGARDREKEADHDQPNGERAFWLVTAQAGRPA